MGRTMDVYKINDIAELLSSNPYPGRGIVIGKTPDGTKAVAAYFIMGRSANSRNRIFAERGGAVFTEPYDASRVEDPSLIIYRAVAEYEDHLIVTNGDHTETVLDGLARGLSFSEALASRRFEPDAPHLTPRISALMTFSGGLSYSMSILKSADPEGTACSRYFFDHPAMAGVGHLIHTYMGDGSPLPSYCGEPARIATLDDIDEFTERLWNALDEDNRISLYVRYTDLKTGERASRTVNKNK